MTYKPGEEILRCQPFSHVVSQALVAQICDACLKQSTNNLQRCSGCKYIRYCGAKCQKASWTQHKEECQYLKKVSPKIPPDTVRLLARIIIKLKTGGSREIATLPDGSKRAFADLMSHQKEIIRDQHRMEAFNTYFEVLRQCFKDIIPKQEVFEIYGKVLINSFNIMNDDYLPVGIGLYLAPSTLDHACRPNATVVFTGKTLHVRCIEPVNLFTEVRIGYTSLSNTKSNRQEDLKSQYYFDCECPECLEETQESKLREALKFGALQCTNCHAPVVIALGNCMNCKTELLPEKVDKQQALVQEVREKLFQNKYCHPEPMEQSEEFLDDMIGLFHPCDASFLPILEHLYESYISQSKWKQAYVVAQLSLSAYQVLYPKFDVNTGLILLKLGKLASHLGFDREAGDYLKQARAQIKVTHGPYHRLYTEVIPSLLHEVKTAKHNIQSG